MSDMVVSGAEVQKFMHTLKSFSESCSHSKTEVISAKKSVLEAVTTCEAAATECGNAKDAVSTTASDATIQLGEVGASLKTEVMTQCARLKDEMHREGEKIKKKLVDEASKIRKERHWLEAAVSQAQSLLREQKRIANKVEDNEGFVCSFVEVVKNAEALSRQHYSRSLYAASVSREMNKNALQTLASTLELLQTMVKFMKKCGEDDMSDDKPSDSDECSIQGRIMDAIESVRTLQADSDDMSRVVQILDQVSLLDNSLKVLNGDMNGMCVGDDERAARRKQIEKAVRRSMPFNVTQHKNVAAYEREVMSEVSKGMSSTDVVGSSLLTSVLTCLEKDGVERRGQIPPVYDRKEDDDDDGKHIGGEDDDIDVITAVGRRL